MVLINITKKRVLSSRCHFANSFWKRLVGLLNRSSVARGEGLLIDRCYGIHTIGMRFPIDVLFLDKDFRVLRAVKSVRPFRIGPVVPKAVYVAELPAGVVEETGTQDGDQIQMRNEHAEPLPSPRVDASSGVVRA
jgi:uncharacterized membrane protein (UPF0127 family)